MYLCVSGLLLKETMFFRDSGTLEELQSYAGILLIELVFCFLEIVTVRHHGPSGRVHYIPDGPGNHEQS